MNHFKIFVVKMLCFSFFKFKIKGTDLVCWKKILHNTMQSDYQEFKLSEETNTFCENKPQEVLNPVTNVWKSF